MPATPPQSFYKSEMVTCDYSLAKSDKFSKVLAPLRLGMLISKDRYEVVMLVYLHSVRIDVFVSRIPLFVSVFIYDICDNGV